MEIEKLMETAMLGGEADQALDDSVVLIAAMRERYPKREKTAEDGKERFPVRRSAVTLTPKPETDGQTGLRLDDPVPGGADLSQSCRAQPPYLVVPRVVGG